MTEKDYWERFGFWRCRLSDIYTHIKSGMAETENPHCRKGIIVEKDADTESRLDFVKDYGGGVAEGRNGNDIYV